MPLGGDEPAGLAGQRREAAVVVLDDVGMDRLVGEIDEEGGVAGAVDEALDVIGEEIGGVALGLHPRAIDVQRRVDGLALSRHRHPMVEARTRAVVVAHVPLAEEAGAVSGLLQVERETGRRWLSRAVLSVMPLVCGYWPVRKLARLGEHSGVVAKALVKRAPSAASRFMCGVSRNGWPAAPRSSHRMSSTSTNTRLGRRGGGAVACRFSAGALHVALSSAETSARTPAGRGTAGTGPRDGHEGRYVISRFGAGRSFSSACRSGRIAGEAKTRHTSAALPPAGA